MSEPSTLWCMIVEPDDTPFARRWCGQKPGPPLAAVPAMVRRQMMLLMTRRNGGPVPPEEIEVTVERHDSTSVEIIFAWHGQE